MKGKHFLLGLFAVAVFASANAVAGTFPQRMAMQHDNGWEIVEWSAGQIGSLQKDASWIEYYTYDLDMNHVNAIFARIGKWGGGSDTDAYYDYRDFYFNEPFDTLHETCSRTIEFGKTGERICDDVDYPAEATDVVTTCYDDDGDAHTCRRYQMGEYAAYHNNFIATELSPLSGYNKARYAMMKYKYYSSNDWYYRTFMIFN